MNLLDILTLISYGALNIDIAFQIRQMHKTKSSEDVSLIGLFIRYVAICVILIKFISLNDYLLIIGQGLILGIFTVYLFLAYRYSLVGRDSK